MADPETRAIPRRRQLRLLGGEESRTGAATAAPAPLSPTSPRWTLAQRIALRFLVSYFALFFLTDRVADILPASELITRKYIELWLPVVAWVGRHLFGGRYEIYILEGGQGVNNTAFGTTLFLCYLVLAAVATLVWSALDRRREHYRRLHQWLRLLLRASLGLAMLTYGLIKALPTQMVSPPCQLDAKFPPSLYVKNPPLWLSRLTGAGSLQVPSGTWCCVGWAAGWPKATSPMSVSLLPPRRRGAGGLWETRSVFQGVWEGAGRGAGGGSLPYPGRPPAGVMGAGGRGAFSASNLWKNTPRRQADPGRIHHVSPGRIIPLNPPAPQRRPGRQPRRQCRARYASAGQPCASP